MKKLILMFVIFTSFTMCIDHVSAETKVPVKESQSLVVKDVYEKYIVSNFNIFIKSVDKFRLSLASEFEKKLAVYKKQKQDIIDSPNTIANKTEMAIKSDDPSSVPKQNYFNSKSGNPISLIWISLLIYLLTFLIFTFTTAYIFYLFFGLIIFLALRFVWTYLL